MAFHSGTNSWDGRTRILGCLALTLTAVAAASVAAADAVAVQRDPAQAWPELLERFRKLSPTQRLRAIETSGKNVVTSKVERGILRVDFVARGTLEASRSSDVVCLLKTPRAKSGFASTIKWVIDEGTEVKPGDKLVELDDGFLQDELKVRVHALDQARTAQRKAQDNLKRVQTENEIEVRLAEIALKLVELRLKRDKGADRDLTEELQLKAEQSRLGIKRAKVQATAKEAEAQEELDAKTAVVERETHRKNELEAELPKCVLRAAQGGVVMYYVPEQIRFGRGQQAIVAQGEPVREGQKLLLIPDLSQMQVIVRVPEPMVAHLRAANPQDPRSRQRAQIRVDAYPGRMLPGHVQAVDNVASQQDWLASGVKAYKTIVTIDSKMENLKPGMSAEVRITVQQTSGPVLHVPLQAIVTAGKKRLCFVVTGKEVQEREVVTGLHNDEIVEVRSGLKEGDVVLYSPRTLIERLAPGLEDRTR